MRVVLPAGSEPASAEPSRIEKNGTAIRSINAAAAAAISAGRSLSARAQRPQLGDSSLLVSSPAASLRRALRPSTRVPKNPSRAGSSVNAATTVNRTATLAATATP